MIVTAPRENPKQKPSLQAKPETQELLVPASEAPLLTQVFLTEKPENTENMFSAL